MKRREIRLLLTVLLVLISYVASTHPTWIQQNTPAAVQAIQPGYYSVTTFTDGDTIAVDMNGVNEKVRFIGVDTPESLKPNTPVQCFAKAASAYTKNLIGKNPVRLEADPTNTNRDRYKRLLRYVYLPDGTLVNARIIQDGYGFAYVGFPFQKLEEFRSYERQAREQNRGLWADCQTSSDQKGRESTSPAQ